MSSHRTLPGLFVRGLKKNSSGQRRATGRRAGQGRRLLCSSARQQCARPFRSGTLTAGIAEASIDRSNGQIRVHNFWCTLGCGVAVQPDNVVAQTESSIVYGLGMALSERITIKDGAVEQSNFYDYRVPRMNEVPMMHIEVIATDNHPTGVGQMATPLVAPAISGAVAQLTGARLRHTPFTPERVKKALA
jgi:isoquinoline 1-oxidoreductase beta subunit